MVYINNLSVMNVSERRGPLVPLLPTAIVLLYTEEDLCPVRALFSVESQQNFITEACLNKYNFPMSGGAPPIQILDGEVKHILGRAKISVCGRLGEDTVTPLDFLVTDHIMSNIPSSRLHSSVKEPLLYFHLADPTFDQPGDIDLLLGRRVLAQILKAGEYNIPDTCCYAHDTTYGWIVMGGAPEEDEPEEYVID